MSMMISSSAFANNEKIPLRYAREGEDLSPPLVWDDLPAGTAELALDCDDPDAPTADPFVHWVIYGLSPDLKGLPEAIPVEGEVREPVRARQGENSWGRIGYDGPAPPRGKGLHHYHFTLYALGRRLELPPGLDKGRLLKAMEGAVLGKTTVTGLYER
jgi:Raf kinase inhibitor-like YbhB/YbcL family protein